MTKRVIVIGAGMVGTATAWELAQRGAEVVLLDRRAPGEETSHGNAGVITRSSLVPLNNPGLWSSLPSMIGNRTASLRYRLGYLSRNALWAAQFLKHANERDYQVTTTALDQLIQLSFQTHLAWLSEAGLTDRLRHTGWMLAYRSNASFERGQAVREAFDRFQIAYETLNQAELAEREPALNPVFQQAVLVTDAMSVDSPGAVVKAYAKALTQAGGQVKKAEVVGLSGRRGQRVVHCANGTEMSADALVIALGPWSAELLRPLGYRLPLGFERGYHQMFAPQDGPALTRPFYDVERGYVASPMAEGIRVTTGVELADRDAPSHPAQMILATGSAREALAMGAEQLAEPWRGARPTLPDSRPIIGAAPHHPDIWLGVGHHHIGFSTGPGTAKLLSALMFGDNPPIDPSPFRAERFLT